MSNRISPRIGWALMALVGLACSEDQPTQSTQPTQPTPPQGVIVTVSDNAFSPNSTVAAAGTQVTWQWQGIVQHSVVFDTGPITSGLKDTGTFNRTFTTAGSYFYHCEIHGAMGMTGVVTVNSSGDGTPPPAPGPYGTRE